MNKAKLNFVIDALMFLCMAAIAGFGFLMKYVLLPGRESTIKYGRRVDLALLGLDRHDWGAGRNRAGRVSFRTTSTRFPWVNPLAWGFARNPKRATTIQNLRSGKSPI